MKRYLIKYLGVSVPLIVIGTLLWFLVPACVSTGKTFIYVMKMPNTPVYMKYVNSFKNCGCYQQRSTKLRGTFLGGSDTDYVVICESGHPYSAPYRGPTAYEAMLLPKCVEDPLVNAKNKKKALDTYTSYAKSVWKP